MGWGRFVERLRYLFYTCAWDPVEFGAGVFLVLVGGWYALPFDTFSVSASYRWAQTWPTEGALGWAMASVGAATVLATWLGHRRFRLVSLFVAFWLLLFVGSLLILSSPASAGLAIFGSLAAAPGWAWLRLMRGASWASPRNGYPSSQR